MNAAGAAQRHFAEGHAHATGGDPVAAEAHYRAAIALQPGHFESHVNLGNLLCDGGRNDEAAACFRRALQLRPQVVELNLNLGLALHRLQRFDEAVEAYRAVAARGSAGPGPHANLAGVLRDAGRLDEALASCEQALARAPGHAPLQLMRADLCLARGDAAEAVAGYRRAIALDPSYRAAHQSLLLGLLYLDGSTERDLDQARAAFATRFLSGLPVAPAWEDRDRDPQRRLRVGYVSGDLRLHSVAYFIEPMLARHDRSAFEIHAYSTAPARDEVSERLRSLADAWHEAAALSDAQLAERIRADGIDLLVDLSGHTRHNRIEVFARQAAPVQLGWIGYPAATGVRQIAWRLTDPQASPPALAREGSGGAEAWHRLPRIFSVYRPPAQAPDPESCGDHDPGAPVTLGSFNHPAKLSEATVRLWSRILREAAPLRLLLKVPDGASAAALERMRSRFRAHGVDPQRIALAGRAPDTASHLARYAEVDVALDPFPYNGVTTTCEALWMGVPVVSLAGREFHSRMGATLLSAIGCAHWAADDEDAYVRQVLALAADAGLRRRLRRELRERMRASALMDEAGVAREVEAAYRELWRRWCAGPESPSALPTAAIGSAAPG